MSLFYEYSCGTSLLRVPSNLQGLALSDNSTSEAPKQTTDGHQPTC